MATKAASFAADIENALDTPVQLEKGRRGQFEVVVEGETVVCRKGGLIAKLIGRPWPKSADIVEAVRAEVARKNV